MPGFSTKDVCQFLEAWAPLPYQEPYDNSGLLTATSDPEVRGVLVCLDCTEAVVEEAVHLGCNLVVAHHPIIFKGLKKLTGSNYVERTVMAAVRNNIALYALHTNLDNVHTGVNRKICEKIGLKNLRVLAPKTGLLKKLVTFIPRERADAVLEALYAAGAGRIGNYEDCSFRVDGSGSFRPNEFANPVIGKKTVRETVTETRVEVLFPAHLQGVMLGALKDSHPYEEVAYYIQPLDNTHQEVGAGMVGELDTPLEPMEFLRRLKERMNLKMVRHTSAPARPVKRVAVCGGAGSFLLPHAIQAGAEAFISADFKYHEFFDAEGKILIADIGHYESEVFTIELIVEVLTKKFPTFAINFSRTVTNPISYL